MAKGKGRIGFSLKVKIILFIIFVSILPFAIVMLFLINSLTVASINVEGKALDQTTILVEQDLLSSAGSKAQVYDLTFKSMIIDLDSIKDGIIDEGFSDKLLTSYYYKHQVISGVYFINSSGSIFIAPSVENLAQGERIDLSKIKEFSFLYSGNESKYSGRWLGPYDDFKSQAMIMTYVLPVWNGSESIGIVGMDITVGSMFTEIVTIDPSQSSYFFIARSNGEFFSSSDKIYGDFGMDSGEASIFNSHVIKDQGLSDIFTSISKKDGVFTIQGTGGTEKIVAFSLIPSFGGKIVIVSPLSEIIQVQKEKASEIQQVVNNVGVSGFTYMIVITIFIVIVSVFILQRSVTNPVTKLRRGIEGLEKTGFSTKIDIKSKDEFGQLASAFNQMTEDLKVSRAKLEEYSKGLEKQVAERTKELEGFNKLAVGRELKMIELKKRIKELEEKK
jgi:HAMP domain-containing protein